ncbi:MAG TPA: phospholipase D-like domain-containing protein [Beijerinckiaceae bacterium]|nr:phospholipase D-like domain-containing protein [Beijerinckiaceae bacterium]
MPTTPSAETRLQELQQALQQREQLLGRIPGVVKAQVGYRTRDGRLTDELAILVTVMRKRPPSALAPGEEAAQVLAGLPVDVVQASIAEQLAFVEQPAQLAGPTSLIAPPPWETPLPADPLSFMDGDNYVPPDDIKLAEVDKKMSVLCHVSPDAGWPNLKKFIESIEKRLTLAMYDLSAPHIVRRLGSHIKSIRGQLHCIVDPSDTKNGKFDELEETDAIERLDRAIAKFDLVWASVKKNGSLFNTAYHTKVAVADGKRFWLSSGNWQHSNQPEISPLTKPADVPEMKKRNREWHVIVDHQGLADMFERFIEYDRRQSKPFDNIPKKLRQVDLFVAADSILESFAAAPRKVFEPLRVEKKLRVQPLLTPDNFLDHIIPLIESAKKKLYIQNQYFWIQTAATGPVPFRKLADAITKRLEDDVDVRMIFREPDFGDSDGKVKAMLQTFQHRGFKIGEHVKLMPKTHTKGVIVDSNSVALGSHNWSPVGTLHNRDATLIFHDAPEIAQYYERVFLHDWGVLAKDVMPTELFAPLVAGDDEEPPPGMRRITLSFTEGDDGPQYS